MTEEFLYEKLTSLNINFTTYSHQPAFTCAQMDEFRKNLPPYSGVKNLFLKDKKRKYFLLSALHTTTINLKELAQTLPAPELRFARPDELEEVLKVQPGSVTPFALINDTNNQVHLLLDKKLFEQKFIGIHPLRNDKTTLISPHDVEKFITALGYTYQTI